jgi:hypothetical protein
MNENRILLVYIIVIKYIFHYLFSFFRFGASTIQLNKLVPLICKLVSDSNGTVNI